MSRGPSQRTTDVLDAIERCQRYVTVLGNEVDVDLVGMAEDAIERNLQIIGEAVNHLPAKIIDAHPGMAEDLRPAGWAIDTVGRRRKSPAEIADEQRRYALAAEAMSDEDFEPFFADDNQGVRSRAAMNRAASDRVLERFAADRFWGVRVEVAHHPNASRQTILGLLEAEPRHRGVVHAEVRRRLEAEGVIFGDDGMPVP